MTPERSFWFLVFLVLLLALAGACGSAPVHRPTSPAATTSDPEQLYARYAPAIAQVRARFERTVEAKDSEDGSAGTVTTTQRGSAVHLGDGRFLTACHVVRRGEQLEIESTDVVLTLARFSDRGTVTELTELPAKVLRCDRDRDLAIVRAERGKLPEVSVAPATVDPRPGRAALAIGAATRGFAWSAHPCQVAGVGRLRPDSPDPDVYPDDDGRYTRVVLQAACASHAMSGSPLLDDTGALIGVMQFSTKVSNDPEAEEWRFFAPASVIQAFLAEGR